MTIYVVPSKHPRMRLAHVSSGDVLTRIHARALDIEFHADAPGDRCPGESDITKRAQRLRGLHPSAYPGVIWWPEEGLHPDLQGALVSLLRNACGGDVYLVSYAPSIIDAVPASCVLGFVDGNPATLVDHPVWATLSNKHNGEVWAATIAF